MGKSYLNQALSKKLADGKKICIPYIMAGDGGLDHLQEQLQFLKDSGAAAVELGIPFSDPVADGPVIQEAGMRALANGSSLSVVLKALASYPEPHPLPIIVMTYLNPILALGVDQFVHDCVQAGVDGVIIPDLPMEEERIFSLAAEQAEIAFIRLAALTSPPERLSELVKRSDGFVYAVAVSGTTGGRKHDLEKVGPFLEYLKSISTIPVLAGFGISTPMQAAALAGYADGVIIGSRIIELLKQEQLAEVQALIGSI